MQQREIEIINKLGLHARAAAKLVSTANQYASKIEISFNQNKADAKSIMAVMMLAASKGSVLSISTEGEDEEEALNSITMLIEDKFGEDE